MAEKAHGKAPRMAGLVEQFIMCRPMLWIGRIGGSLARVQADIAWRSVMDDAEARSRP